jgi:hypothetical protein
VHTSEDENRFANVKPVEVARVNEGDGRENEHEDENWQCSMLMDESIVKAMLSSLT